MRQLIVDYLPFEITAQQINESITSNDGRLIVQGVLQRAESQNQNGRVYPRNLLMREAKKYTDLSLNVKGNSVARIQETHILLGHYIFEHVEKKFVQ